PDIDEERSHENYDLVNKEDIDFNERVKSIIESQKVGTRKTRKDAVLVNELLVTSDEKFFKDLSPNERDRFFKESYELFSERYGKQNIAYARVHLDEKTPHMHLGVVPMRDGKLQGKNVFNRQELLWIQDKFPEQMQKLGFELERGEKGSAREHIESSKFKKQTLEKEIDSLEKNLSAKKDELKSLSGIVPTELKIKAKKEKKTVIEEKLVHFGKPKTIEKETGNLVVTRDEYKKMSEIVHAAATIKKDYDRLQSTDLVQENKDLHEALDSNHEALLFAQERNGVLERENKTLKNENRDLRAYIFDLRDEISSIYKNTREFLKARTKDVRAFKNVFKEFVVELKNKVTGSEFEKLHKREQARERDKGLER
ncbi:MobV family relaxase, partial [Bacillus changyiensis]|uniref:MobV family relaxase n=1 Tax=Bacillus changyiensis TaxID=3004103 RepID=UPI0022DFADA4